MENETTAQKDEVVIAAERPPRSLLRSRATCSDTLGSCEPHQRSYRGLWTLQEALAHCTLGVWVHPIMSPKELPCVRLAVF